MSFIRSVWLWLTGRKPLAPLPVIEVRAMICEGCPARRQSWWRYFCALCGCTLSRRRSIFNKLAMPHEECPAKRW